MDHRRLDAAGCEDTTVRGRTRPQWLTLERLPSAPLVLLIEFYRHVISPLTPPTCRFTPSCSRYALDAVKRYGMLRGGWLAAWRILRCNPMTHGGYDPLR